MSADFLGAGFTGWAVEALIASTILMTFVLLVRKHAQRALGPQLAYWLWALPALRMAMPPLPASWRESAAAPLSAASETVLILVEPILPAATASDAVPFPWLALAAGAWVLGALAFFAWHGLAHFSYVRRIVAPPATRAQLPDGTTLVESDEAIGPVAFGVLKRFVAVPTDFAERYDADERKLALAHELGHHARGDLIANWIALAVLACHWFNPIAWIAYRKYRSDQEMANDARVLSALPPIERHAYACAIVKAAHGRAVTAACHLHTIEDLKGRLRMLKASRKSRRVLMAGAVGIASLTVAGLGLTASGAAAEKIRTVAETQVASLADPIDPAVEAAIGADGKTTTRDTWVVIKDKDGNVVDLGDDARVPAGAKVHRNVVIVKDGQTTTYEGDAAEAFIAANPDAARHADKGKLRKRIVIRKEGRTVTYEGADAEAYLKAHPDMKPPMSPAPPVPPIPGAASVPAPRAPAAPLVVTTDVNGHKATAIVRSGPGGYAYATANAPEVIEGDCRGGDKREFVRKEVRNGQARMVICKARIERFAENQARTGKRVALSSLNASRAAIVTNRGLTEAQRAQALAGIDEARRDLEREIREGKAD